jgi:secreted trypsin-like serine protease
VILTVAVSALTAPAAAARGQVRRVAGHHAVRARASIVGGEVAKPSTFPSLAYVADFREGVEIGLCTGTVVAPRLVLTAGHCAENVETGVVNEASGYRVVTGNVNWTASPREVFDVTDVVPYPGYESSGLLSDWGDAALLVLSSPTSAPAIPFVDAAEPELWRAGKAGVIAGWGETSPEQVRLTEALRWTPTVLQSPEWCSDNFSGFHPLGQLCAIDAPSDAAGACEGDSGGPLLVMRSAGEFAEVGITVQVADECSTRHPTVFTRTSMVAPWIDGWAQTLTPPKAAATPSAPAAAATPVATATPPPPLEGVYRGTTSQSAHALAIVVGSGSKRLTALTVPLTYRCRSGREMTSTLEALSNREYQALNSNQTFDAHFTGSQSSTMTGSFDQVSGAAHGTITSVWNTRTHGRCVTGSVSWSAQRQAVASSAGSYAAAGTYRGYVNGETPMGMTVASTGKLLVGVQFSAVYQCPDHRNIRPTESSLSPKDPQALEPLGTFTVLTQGPGHYHGRVDGAFGLLPGAAYGTLDASDGTGRARCTTGLLYWYATLPR